MKCPSLTQTAFTEIESHLIREITRIPWECRIGIKV